MGPTYVHNAVTNQLAAQQIYFPPQSHPKAGTEITPNMIPSVSQYARAAAADRAAGRGLR